MRETEAAKQICVAGGCRAGGSISTRTGGISRCVHAVQCKHWLPDRFDIDGEFEHNCTPCLRREYAKSSSSIPDRGCMAGASRRGSCRLRRSSERLDRASLPERSRAELSPSGYGILWPLIDEDFATARLLRCACPQRLRVRSRPQFQIRFEYYTPRPVTNR